MHYQQERPRRDQAEVAEVVIRPAAPADARTLRRLALLDSAPDPHGPMIVAESDGVLVAATPLGGGRSIADPFEPSEDIVGLLELRRAQLCPG
jgi:hypothetical protein